MQRKSARRLSIQYGIDLALSLIHIFADGGIFGPAELRQAISDRIVAWGVADEPQLKQFVIS